MVQKVFDGVSSKERGEKKTKQNAIRLKRSFSSVADYNYAWNNEKGL